MKKVLVVMSTLGMGGAEKSLISFLNMVEKDFLDDNKISIDFLTADSGSLLIQEIPSYINILKCPLRYKIWSLPINDAYKYCRKTSVFFWKSIYKLNCKMSKCKATQNEVYWIANRKFIPRISNHYDVCIAYMNGGTTYFAIDKVKAKKKYVWVHNEYEKLNYTDEFQRDYFEQADGIITISERCVDSIINRFPEFSSKVKMIENISSSNIILKKADAYLPKEYEAIDDTIIVSVGRLVEQKGFDIGIDAVKLLINRGDKVKWYIVGEGSDRASLQKKIDVAGFEDTIYLLGIRENPYPYIKNADIFFQPSRFEGKSITLDEAKLLNKAIVVSNYSTVYDSIRDGENGSIANLDPEDLAKKIHQLIENPELKNKYQLNLASSEHGNEKEIYKYQEMLLGGW